MRAARILIIFLLALCLNACDPLGISSRIKDVSKDVFVQFYAPFYGGDRRLGQENIAVVLIDQYSLELLGWRYALDYPHHREYLTFIAQYKPAAIFLDFLFARSRPAPEGERLSDLTSSIQELSERPRAPKIFVGIDQRIDGPPEFEMLRSAKNVEFVQTAWSRAGDDYPIYPLQDATTLSPAAGLYRQFCNSWPEKCNLDRNTNGGATDEFLSAISTPPISLVWGYTPSDLLAEFDPGTKCETFGKRTFWRRLNRAIDLAVAKLLGGTRPTERQLCPYNLAVPIGYLFELESQGKEDLVEKFLGGRIVLIGVAANVSNDEVVSPIHGVTSGIQLHAMALDNLIEWNRAYFRDPPTLIGALDQADIVEALLAALALAFTYWHKDQVELARSRQPRFTWGTFVWLHATPLAAASSILVFAAVTTFAFRWTPTNWLGLFGVLAIFLVLVGSQSMLSLLAKWAEEASRSENAGTVSKWRARILQKALHLFYD